MSVFNTCPLKGNGYWLEEIKIVSPLTATCIISEYFSCTIIFNYWVWKVNTKTFALYIICPAYTSIFLIVSKYWNIDSCATECKLMVDHRSNSVLLNNNCHNSCDIAAFCCSFCPILLLSCLCPCSFTLKLSWHLVVEVGATYCTILTAQ